MTRYIITAISCFITGWAIAATTPIVDLLAGQTFTNPDQVAQMPAGWESQRVKYSKENQDADLVISLGQQTYPALKDLVDKYAKQNNLRIAIESGTCGISAGKLIRKTVDSGTFCCPAGENDRMPGLEFHTIAISPIAVIVNSKNPLNEISLTEARNAFQGQVRDWTKVTRESSMAENVIPVARLHCKPRPGHWTRLLRHQDLFGSNIVEVGVIPDLIAKVAQTKNAISIETPFMVRRYGPDGTIKMLNLDGVSPLDMDAVAAGKYPMYRTYSLTTWSNGEKQRDLTLKLVKYLREHIEQNGADYTMVSISKLKRAGWRFRKDELIAEPDGNQLAQVPMQ